MTQKARPRARTKEGVVVSDASDKTIVVSVRRLIKHPQYHKYVQVSKKYVAHDERNEGARGDRVLIAESRPISKRKRWRLRTVLDRALKDVPEIKEVPGVEGDAEP